MAILQITQVLMVDLYPGKGASVAANVRYCSLAHVLSPYLSHTYFWYRRVTWSVNGNQMRTNYTGIRG